MARIRTIKPEFPQSESMGRVSRDARLCFVELWTLADDSGRLRGSSRMLASLLFPYDDDAPSLIDGWLWELQDENCIIQYEDEGQHYIQIVNWLQHQKIDKPSKSFIPAFGESSRILSNPLECSSEDLGPRTKDLGPRTKDQGPRTKERTNNGDGKKSNLPAKKPDPDPLYQAVFQSFISKVGAFTNYPKEALAIKRIIKYCAQHAPQYGGDQVELVERSITKFYELTQNGDRFWRGQPFTPSALSSPGLFDRVLVEIGQDKPEGNNNDIPF